MGGGKWRSHWNKSLAELKNNSRISLLFILEFVFDLRGRLTGGKVFWRLRNW